jgi:transposase-like protein
LDIGRSTKRQHSVEEKTRIVRDGLRVDFSIAETAMPLVP